MPAFSSIDPSVSALIVLFYIVFLAFLVAELAAGWRIYVKAGRAGWTSLVPVYSLWVLVRIAGYGFGMFILCLIPGLNFVALGFLARDLARSFNRSGAFAVGLYLLTPIFYLMLAFGEATYIGPAAQRGGPYALGNPTYAGTAPSDGAAYPSNRSGTSVADPRRSERAKKTLGIATFVLLVTLFLPWFGVTFSVYSATVDGLFHGWMYITLLVAIAIEVYLVLKISHTPLPSRNSGSKREPLTIGAAINAFLTVIAFASKPGGTSWQYGAFVGLLAALVALAAGISLASSPIVHTPAELPADEI